MEEAREILANLESDIVNLEGHYDKELFNNIFRYVHTLKGSSGMAGVTTVYEFSHQLENLMDLVRSERISVTEEIIDLLLNSLDYFRDAIFGSGEDVKRAEDNKETLLSRIFDIVSSGTGNGKKAEPSAVKTAVGGKAGPWYYRVTARFKENIYENGIDPLRIIGDCCSQGELLERAVDRLNLPELGDMDPEKCYISWTLLIKSDKNLREIQDVFLFVKDDNEIDVEDVTAEFAEESELPAVDKRIGELLVDKGVISEEAYEEILETQEKENKRFGEIVVEKGYASEKDMDRALTGLRDRADKGIVEDLTSIYDTIGHVLKSRQVGFLMDILRAEGYRVWVARNLSNGQRSVYRIAPPKSANNNRTGDMYEIA